MPASASFSLEDGMRTWSCAATLPLRRRVSMSAIGSVIVIGTLLLSPARLRDAGDLARMDQLAQADAAQPEVPEHGAGPPAPTAAGVGPHLVQGLAGLLDPQRLLGH